MGKDAWVDGTDDEGGEYGVRANQIRTYIRFFLTGYACPVRINNI